jgi:AraC-like DNA-binding protein
VWSAGFCLRNNRINTMKKTSLIAATAVLLAAGWFANVQLCAYASSDSQADSAPLAWHRPPTSKGVATLSYETFQKRRGYIEANFQRFTTVEQIAREFHSSVADLDRAFRLEGHVRLEQYLAHLRRNRAVEQRLHSDGLAMVKQTSLAP